MTIITVKTGGIAADAVTDAKIADDIVGTEHLTANEVDTAALKGDAVTSAELADDAVDSEHYTDGSIDTAHLADGQVTTAKLATAVFTAATDIGAAIVDADLFLMDDGAGGTIRKTTAARIKTYAGATNTPAFEATLSGAQTISDATATKLTFTGETFDTDGTFASSRFTPAVAGTYFVYYKAVTDPASYANERDSSTYFYKNGSKAGGTETNFMTGANSSTHGATATTHVNHGIFVLDDDDYIEVYGDINTHSDGDATFKYKVFGGYRIIT